MIKAYGSNVVVQIPTNTANTTKSGLYIPEGTSSSGNQVVSAKVISVGPMAGIGAWNGMASNVIISVDDTIWFQKPNSIEFEFNNEKYQVVPDNAVLVMSAGDDE